MIPFPYVDKDMTKNGVTFEVQPDGGVRIYGKAVETVDFFLSMLDYGNDSIFNNSTGNGKILSGGKDGVGIEYHGTNKRLYLTIVKGKTVNTVIYPQLQNGSTATAYEPYTGDKPSPSPEYPQEIKSVGKWNPETQKYEVDIKVTNAKESWDKEQTLTLSLDQPLQRIGNFKDVVTKDGIIRKNYKQRLEGTQISRNEYNWDATIPNFRYYIRPISKVDSSLSVTDCPCTIGKMSIYYSINTTLYWAMNADYIGYFGVTPEDTETSALNKIKNFVDENEIYVVYPLETPITEPLPEDFKQALEKLSTYYPTTVITVDGGEVDPGVEITYIADTKNYIDQKIAAINKTVVETQKALL